MRTNPHFWEKNLSGGDPTNTLHEHIAEKKIENSENKIKDLNEFKIIKLINKEKNKQKTADAPKF